MRLQSITINNYRSFGESDNTLQVNPGVTTIIGMNGSGKSNLIDAISQINPIHGSNTQNWQRYRNIVTDNPVGLSVKLLPLEEENSDIFDQKVTEISITETTGYTISGGVYDAYNKRLSDFDALVLKRLAEASIPNAGERESVLSNARGVKSFSKQPLANSRAKLIKLKTDAEKYIKDDKK